MFMPEDNKTPAQKVHEAYRQIGSDQIAKCCVYRLPKGVRLKDFNIEENANSKKTCIIALGGGGIKIAQSIMKYNNAYMSLMTHVNHLGLDGVHAEYKLYLMCDIEDKELLTIENRGTLSEFVSAHKKVYLITTLGNEIRRSQAIEKISQHLHRIGREVIVIAVKPFIFELYPERIDAINETLGQLDKFVSKIIVFHNEDMVDINEVSAVPMHDCFELLDHAIASVIQGDYNCGDERIIDVFFGAVINE